MNLFEVIFSTPFPDRKSEFRSIDVWATSISDAQHRAGISEIEQIIMIRAKPNE